MNESISFMHDIMHSAIIHLAILTFKLIENETLQEL